MNSIKTFLSYLLVGALIASIIFGDIFRFDAVNAATFTFTQTSWAGGLDGGTYPIHPTNQTSWTKYDSKSSFITAGASGFQITTSTTPTATQTSDTDFGLGTHSATEVTGSGSSASVRLGTVTGSTVGHWPFTEGTGASTTDATGNGNNGALTNFASPPTATSGWTSSGKLGYGLNFDGTNDFVTFVNSSGLPVYSKTTAYSVSFWVKSGATPGTFASIFSETNGATTTQFFRLRTGNTSVTKLNVILSDDTGAIPLNARETTADVIDGTWHHVVWTDNAGAGKVYVDGVLDSTSFSYTPGANSYTFNQTRLGTANFFKGTIDDVRIYSRALSSTEAATLYSLGNGTGTFTSGVIDTTASSTFTTLSYSVTTPASTTVTIDARAGNVASPDGTWTSWQTGISSGGSIAGLGTKRYIQYRANLTTADESATPTLDSITINYLHSPVELYSSAYNSVDSTNVLAQIYWTAATSSASTAKFQLRTAPNNSGSPGTWGSWMGPDGTEATYFTDHTGGETIPAAQRDGTNDQWFQYKAIITSTDATLSALISSVSVKYVVNAAPEFETNYPTTAAGGVSASQNADGTVSINYSVLDQDTNTGSITPGYVTPSFEYSTNGGGAWAAITGGALGASATSSKAVAQATYTTYSATWTVSSTLPATYNANMKVRVTVNDNEGANNTATATSAAFTVDTTTPTVSTYTLNVGAGTISLAATDNSNIMYRLSNNSDLSADGSNATSGAWQTVGASSTSATINWTFASSTNPVVYLEVADVFSNQTNRTGVAPQLPQNFQIQDVSNVTANDYREFIYWQVYTASTSATFASYKINRSTDGVTYGLLTTISDANFNYYLDTSLSSSTTYYYKVQTFDSDGDSSEFTAVNSDLPNGQGGTDVTPPVISGVTVGTPQSTSVVITWTTDELSSSIVEYSADPSLAFNSSTTISTMVTSHTVTVTGLTPNTGYHFMVRSNDIFDNSGTNANGGGGYSFTTSGGPTISNVTAQAVTDQTALISWNTNNDSTSIVKYDTSSSFANVQQAGSNALIGGASSSVGFVHQVTITGLTAGTTYYYYVESTDSQANTSTDNNAGNYYNFHTTQDTTGPTISNISTPVVAANTVVVVWQTDELATTQVAYGTASTSLNTLTTLDSTLSIYHIATITGLNSETQYFFSAYSKDSSNNQATSNTQTFTTPQDLAVLVTILSAQPVGGGGGGAAAGGTTADATPPVMSNVTVKDIGAFGATVAWHTNEATRSFVEVTDNKRKVTVGSVDPGTDPTILLTNLRMGEQYSVVPKSIDLAGNLAIGDAKVFKTKFVAEISEDLKEINDIADLQEKLNDIIESSLPSLRPPVVADVTISNITDTGATFTWKTNIKGSTMVALATKDEYRDDAEMPYKIVQSGPDDDATTVHSLTVTNLTPNTLYHYQVRTQTLVGTLGKSPDKSFATKAGRVTPLISGTTNRSFIVSWTTGTPATSVVEYKDITTGTITRKDSTALVTKHEIVVDNLPQGGTYEVRVYGSNENGPVISSEPVRVVVKRDLVVPVISEFKVASFVVPGRSDRVQTVVTWTTDEPSTSVVTYGEGSIQNANDLTSRYEDTKNLTLSHTVALLNLKPQTVYTLLITSADQFGNKVNFGPRSIITPAEAESIFDVIFSNFNDTFKFIKNIKQ